MLPERAPEPCMWTQLVARMQASDTAAFETVMSLTQDAGWRLACQMLKDPHQAQDVVQEAYIVVFTRLHTLREPAAFRGWFLRIVLNLCRNARRSRDRAPMVAEPEILSDVASSGSAFEERVTQGISISNAMDTLTPLERSSILLRVPLGTVKSRINAARRQLVRRLRGDERA